MKKSLIILLFICLLPLCSFSQETVNETTVQTESELGINYSNSTINDVSELNTFGFFDFLKMIVVLSLIILVIFLFFRILKKVSAPSTLQNDGFFKVISTTCLSGDRYLHIVKASDNYYIMSSSSNGVQLIEKVEEKDLRDAIVLFEGSIKTETTDFADTLKSLILGKSSKVSNDEKISELKGLFKSQSDRLNNRK